VKTINYKRFGGGKITFFMVKRHKIRIYFIEDQITFDQLTTISLFWWVAIFHWKL